MIQTIGLSVGAAVAYIIIVLGLMFYCKKRRKAKRLKKHPEGEEPEMECLNGEAGTPGGGGFPACPIALGWGGLRVSRELPKVSCSWIWLWLGAETCCRVRNRQGKGAQQVGAKPASQLRVVAVPACCNRSSAAASSTPLWGHTRPLPRERRYPYEAVVLCQPLQTPVQQLLVLQGRLFAERSQTLLGAHPVVSETRNSFTHLQHPPARHFGA